MVQYLSVHDLVWINSTATGETLSFDYETLEQAMAAQYSYGDSRDIPVQAANLLHTIVAKRPFEFGNFRTAYVAVVTFLVANGYRLKVTPAAAAEILLKVNSGGLLASSAIVELAEAAEPAVESNASLRALVTQVFNQHSDAIKLLAKDDE